MADSTPIRRGLAPLLVPLRRLRPRHLVWGLVGAAPVAFAAWYVAGFAFVVPLFDHLLFLERYGVLASGDAGLRPLVEPHNALQPAVVPRAILAALAFASGWSLRLEAVLNLLMLGATLGALLDLALRSPWGGRRPVRVASLLTCFVLWSPAQYWAWIWTVSFAHYLGNLCFVLALWALARGARPLAAKRVAFAAALCVAATFDRFEGLFTWVALLPLVVAFGGTGRRRRALVAAWCGVAVAASAACLALLASGPAPARPALPPEVLAPGSLVAAAGDLLRMIAIPLVGFREWLPVGAPSPALLPLGALLIVAGLAAGLDALRDRDPAVRREALPWGSLAIFSGLFCAAIAVARMPELEGSVLRDLYLSVYSTTSALFAVASIQLGGLALARMRSAGLRIGVGVAATAVLGSALVAIYVQSLPLLLELRHDSARERYCFELLRHLAPYNTCFWGGPNPVNRDALLLEPILRTGFRRVRSDLRTVPGSREQGGILGVRRDPGRPPVVQGWVRAGPGTGARPDAVVVGVAGAGDSLLAIASWERRVGDRWLWSARLPEPPGWRGRRLGVWLYDRERGELVALPGSVAVGRPRGGR